MIDANRLLGSLLSSGMNSRDSGLGGFGSMRNQASLGLGLLGAAFAAFEHFSEQRKSSPDQNTPALPMQRVSRLVSTPVGGAPPPPPLVDEMPFSPGPSSPAAPPPPPPFAAASFSSAPAKMATAPIEDGPEDDAKLYLRAMISAAASDGHIDDQEREHIFGKLEESGLSDDERDFLISEMNWPMGLDEIVAAVQDRKQGMKVYLSSLLAIEVDTDVEREYLRSLAQRLEIAPEILDSIHSRFNISI